MSRENKQKKKITSSSSKLLYAYNTTAKGARGKKQKIEIAV